MTWFNSEKRKNSYGISSGKTSVMMLIESVLAFEVGAAASKIFKRAIMYCGSDGNIALYRISAGVEATGPSGRERGCWDMSSSALGFKICSLINRFVYSTSQFHHHLRNNFFGPFLFDKIINTCKKCLKAI